GGLLYIHDGQVIKLDRMDTTGICHSYDRILRGVQPGDVYISGYRQNSINYVRITLPDVHDVLIQDGACYAVGTQRNEVVKFDGDGNILQRFTFPGENDSWHINCLIQFKGRLFFSAFGDFRTYQAYKESPIASGFVQDLHTGERVITKLSQPHSLTDFGTNLLLANSYEDELHEYDGAFQLVRKKHLGGYTRGILI
ncbi:glycosyl transferase, group 2 family protein, partial [mine drainage metagenome]